MATTLDTRSTPEGIVCKTTDGKTFGVITYGETRADRWIARPQNFDAKPFRSLEGAEFYMLACAAEDGEIMREVNYRLSLAEQAGAGDEDAARVLAAEGDATPEAAARIAAMIRAELPADMREELAPEGWRVAETSTEEDA